MSVLLELREHARAENVLNLWDKLAAMWLNYLFGEHTSKVPPIADNRLYRQEAFSVASVQLTEQSDQRTCVASRSSCAEPDLFSA